LRLPIRMTVIRLVNGSMLLHSPTRFDAALKSEIEQIGRISRLVAPNSAHWTFVKAWREHVPEAVTWAAPDTMRKRRGAAWRRWNRIASSSRTAPGSSRMVQHGCVARSTGC
jgi:hypothetical protein